MSPWVCEICATPNESGETSCQTCGGREGQQPSAEQPSAEQPSADALPVGEAMPAIPTHTRRYRRAARAYGAFNLVFLVYVFGSITGMINLPLPGDVAMFVLAVLVTVWGAAERRRERDRGVRRCPNCAEILELDARTCRFCRYEFPAAPKPTWLNPLPAVAAPTGEAAMIYRAEPGLHGRTCPHCGQAVASGWTLICDKCRKPLA